MARTLWMREAGAEGPGRELPVARFRELLTQGEIAAETQVRHPIWTEGEWRAAEEIALFRRLAPDARAPEVDDAQGMSVRDWLGCLGFLLFSPLLVVWLLFLALAPVAVSDRLRQLPAWGTLVMRERRRAWRVVRRSDAGPWAYEGRKRLVSVRPVSVQLLERELVSRIPERERLERCVDWLEAGRDGLYAVEVVHVAGARETRHVALVDVEGGRLL